MLITTCSYCHAKFRVTEQHLSAADGLVVCSRCRGIFQAKDSLQSMADSRLKAPEHTAAKVSAQLFGTNIRSGRSKQASGSETAPYAAYTTTSAEAVCSDGDDDMVFDVTPSETSDNAPESSFFVRLFGGRKTKKPVVEVENSTSPIQHTDTANDAGQASTQQAENISADAADATRSSFTEQTAQEAPTTNEEFSSVPEPQATEQLALENKADTQTFLPGAHSGDVPTPYDPRFDPRLYPPPPTREEMNWTMASIVALIVLVIQLFYIILQK